MQYLESQIDFDVSPEGGTMAGTWLIAKSGQRQERLTKWVVALTLATLVCAAVTVGLAIISLLRAP